MVAHTCNPTYLGSGDWEFEASPRKMLVRPLPQVNKQVRYGDTYL
jgi:hypothetical protein